MEIRQVYYVLEVAKQRSFSGAAKALYVTQPAISHQINSLEEELQVKLFKRDTHNVSLTSDGEKFCEYAQKIVDSIDDLFQAALTPIRTPLSGHTDVPITGRSYTK